MDLHQEYRILTIPADGIVELREPEMARQAAPLHRVLVGSESVTCDPSTDLVHLLDLSPGRHIEFAVPAWTACVLVVADGFCLTGTDGESPDAHAGQCVVYRRRNRDSAVILVAGPKGCRGSLILAADQGR